MTTRPRLLRLASLAAVLAITSLVGACSSDFTGPTARRSGYITTSAAMQARSTDSKSGTTSTSTGTTSTSTGTTSTGTTSTGPNKTSAADTSGLHSGYNVPAL